MNLQNGGYPCKVTIGTKAHPTDPITDQFAHAFSIVERRVEQEGYKLPNSCYNSADFRATVWLFACRCVVCHTEVYRICEVPSDRQNAWYKPANLAMEQCRDKPFVCPVCGKPKVTTYQRIVGFLTPVRTYSKERKAEFAMRDWMDLNNLQEI